MKDVDGVFKSITIKPADNGFIVETVVREGSYCTENCTYLCSDLGEVTSEINKVVANHGLAIAKAEKEEQE